MTKQASFYKLLIISIFTLLLASCRTAAPPLDYSALAYASNQLNMDIEWHDNPQLYTEAAEWMGVPYRAGGNDKRGVDCSGLVVQLYSSVYGIRLERNAEAQRRKNCHKVSGRHLHEGDLVFFHNGNDRRTASHVGIYLKNGNFIHCSSSRGVTVNHLDEEYYYQHWLCFGRVIN